MMDNNKDLSLLYRYQEARRLLATCEGKLKDPDGQRSINDLKARVQRALKAIERVQKECTRLKTDNRRLEGECRDYEVQLRELETTLYSGKITIPKELEQLQRRIVEYQKFKAEREEKILNQLYLLETKEQDLADAQKKLGVLQGKLEVAEEQEAQRVNSLQRRCTEMEKEVCDLGQALPEHLKEYYQRSAKTLKGIVVSPIKENTCGFCHMIISPAVLEKIKKGSSGMLVCENCGRGLFFEK